MIISWELLSESDAVNGGQFKYLLISFIIEFSSNEVVSFEKFFEISKIFRAK